MNLNRVFILGRTTAAPELRTIPGGASVATFGVATNRSWTSKTGERQEEVEFHNVVVWGRQAEIASQFLVKGGLVFIEGRLRTRAWQDKQGVNHKATEIICERFQLGPKPMGAQGTGEGRMQKQEASAAKPQVPAAEEIPIIDIDEEIKPEDIPF